MLEQALRLAVPALLAALAAFAVDRICARRGLLPPGFTQPWRRVAGGLAVGAILWIGVFLPMGQLGVEPVEDLTQVPVWQLFLLHGLLLLSLAVWFGLGFSGLGGPGTPGRTVAAQLGFVTPHLPQELGLGVVLGLAAWVLVLLALLATGLVIYFVGGEKALPQEPPALVPWIAGLPIAVRLLVSLSAGVVEETFFRGFLQPRVGIGLSTGFFVLAHLSYGQPIMLVGITLLSLVYAFLTRWRQTIWPAITAHALFDAIQLLVVIPAALRLLEERGLVKAVAAIAAVVGMPIC
jgi:membrane protease YdiL (CAAX protease family)